MPSQPPIRDEAIQLAKEAAGIARPTARPTQYKAGRTDGIVDGVDAALAVVATRIEQRIAWLTGDVTATHPKRREVTELESLLTALGVAPTTPEPPKDNYEPPGETPENFIGGAPITEREASLPTHDQEQPDDGA